jgi:DNA-binding transcriptional LysR family regulator
VAGEATRQWLDLRQVAYFVAVAEERSFTAAAARLLIAQPSLSQQIRALERQVGADLLDRSSRGTTLTPAGRAFLEAVRGLLADARTAVSHARAAAGLDGGTLRVAALTSLATWVLPAAIAAFRQRFPDIPLRLTEFTDRPGLEEGMAEGLADVAVGARPPDWTGPVRVLGAERFTLVVPPGHPRAGQCGVPLSAFAGADWVLYAAGHGLRTLVQEACGAAGFTPRVAVECRSVDAAARLAATGLGVALVPDAAARDGLAGHRVELAGAPVVAVVGYARTAFSPPAAAFLDLVTELPIPGLIRPAVPTLTTGPADGGVPGAGGGVLGHAGAGERGDAGEAAGPLGGRVGDLGLGRRARVRGDAQRQGEAVRAGADGHGGVGGRAQRVGLQQEQLDDAEQLGQVVAGRVLAGELELGVQGPGERAEHPAGQRRLENRTGVTSQPEDGRW